MARPQVGRRFYVGSYHALRSGTGEPARALRLCACVINIALGSVSAANMDVLVAVGTSAAYFYSLVG